MSFTPPRGGTPRTPGAEFFNGTVSGGVFSRVATPEGPSVAIRDGGVVGSMGEDRIARSTTLRSQPVERMFTGAPKFWRITNRAQLGHVKVWSGSFDGELYPEGAVSDDKTTWLKPGESMMVPMEAGLHFIGNVFDPRLPEAERIIERYGGFELETEASAPGKNAPVRVIGGPIGLPDFIVEPIDGRFRAVGHPVAVYEVYWNATRRRVVRRKGHDPEVLAAEKELLAERIAEYTMDDQPIYGPDDRPLARTTETEESEDDVPDMRAVSGDGTEAEVEEEEQAVADGDPARTRPPRGGRR